MTDAAETQEACERVVRSFYDALRDRDVERLGQLVAAHVHEDAVLHRPESLPGGGRTVSARRIGRFFAFAATVVDGPVDATEMRVESVTTGRQEDQVDVVVRLAMTYDATPTTAVEWWAFRDGRLQTLSAYYWDTAAMLAGPPA